MTKRINQLFKILASRNEYVDANELSALLGIRPRTLREDIRTNKDYLSDEAGVSIQMKSNKGYILTVRNEDKYHHYMQKMIAKDNNNQNGIPVTQEDRVHFIIRIFLGNNNYVKSEDLCEKLFVSRSTLSSDLIIVRKKLDGYGLKLKTKVGAGLKIFGSEQKIRSCISDMFFNKKSFYTSKSSYTNSFPNIEIETISNLLYKTINKNQFKMNDLGFQNLVVHLFITIARVKEETYVDVHNFNIESFIDKREYYIAKEIATQLRSIYDVEFPENEIIYIAMHLMGKRVYSLNDDQIIDVKTLNLVTEIFSLIHLNTGISLFGDTDLFSMLTLHIQPLMSRLNYDMRLDNPLLEEIKRNSAMSFDLAILAGKVINNYSTFDIDENELGYLALHFELALNRLKHKEIEKKRIVLVCASGAGTSRMLRHNIEKHFKNHIESLTIMSAFEFRDIVEEDYDLIITTIELEKNVSIPLIHINYMLDIEDIGTIQQIISNDYKIEDIVQCFDEELFFSNMDFKNQSDAIKFLVDKLEEVVKVPSEFLPLTLNREKMASTYLGYGVAMPHPTKLLLSKNKVCVCHLAKPITWGDSKVNLIFLLGLSKDLDTTSDNLQKTLLNLFNSVGSLVDIQNNPKFETLINHVKHSTEISDNTESIFK